MQSVTARVDGDTYDRIEELADDPDTSKSAVVRELIRKGLDYDDLETERDRLLDELQATNRRVDEHSDLLDYVDRQRELENRREDRRSAPVWRRAKWWVLGYPGDRGEA
jgi:predicted transcriptional regulator